MWGCVSARTILLNAVVTRTSSSFAGRFSEQPAACRGDGGVSLGSCATCGNFLRPEPLPWPAAPGRQSPRPVDVTRCGQQADHSAWATLRVAQASPPALPRQPSMPGLDEAPWRPPPQPERRATACRSTGAQLASASQAHDTPAQTSHSTPRVTHKARGKPNTYANVLVADWCREY
jgi:hypothetical protein